MRDEPIHDNCGQPTLAIEEVCKRFGQRQALRGVSLNVAPGAWVALVGPNGAGKTTLLRSVVGLLGPDSGTICFEGAPLTPTRRAEALGYAPQEVALYEELTPLEQLVAFAKLLGLRGATRRDRVDEALALAGLQERASDRIGSFSGGMKKRLNIACATLNHPRLLLLDEPTTGVDPMSRQTIWSMLRGLRENGTAILHATHRFDEVEYLCDGATILADGAVLHDGSLEALRETAGLPAYVLHTNAADDDLRVDVASAAELPRAIEQLVAQGANPKAISVTRTAFEEVFQALLDKKANA